MRYEYKCDKCKHYEDVNHPMAEEPVIECPKCGLPMHRVIAKAKFKFKNRNFGDTHIYRGKM